MIDTAVVIVNYRTPDLVLKCLESLESEVVRENRVTVVDNASGDGSADELERTIAARHWEWARIVRSPVNGGFSAGNNLGIEAIRARSYLLLNSDTLVRPGAIARLQGELDEHPEVGLVGPRLEASDGAPQVSAFRQPHPITELLRAAATGPLDRWLSRYVTAMPVPEHSVDADWLSFAAVMIRREVVDQIGVLDAGYFMFFEDVDYCRRARSAGWRVRYCPEARVVHLRGGTSPVKSLSASRSRLPRYYYASRARYYARFHGRVGLWLANGLWTLGRCLSRIRELIEHRPTQVRDRELRDTWTNWIHPLRMPEDASPTPLPGERDSPR